LELVEVLVIEVLTVRERDLPRFGLFCFGVQNYRRLPSAGYILTGRFAAAAAKTPQNNFSISKTLASWVAFHGLLKVREGLQRASAAM